MSFFSRPHTIHILFTCVGLLFATTQSYAASGGDNSAVLQQIANNTNSTNISYLKQIQALVNTISTNVNTIMTQMLAWDKPDKNDTVSPTQQQNFAQYGSAYLSLLNSQNSDTNKQNLLDIILSPQDPTVNISTENDLSYFILQNLIYVPPSQRTPANSEKYLKALNVSQKAQNYILNASAARTPHQTQMGDWNGTADNKLRYNNAYATLMSVQTYGAYVLSQLYLDQQNKNSVQTLQNQLLTQATDSKNWFANILSERISTVIRQILMYESQNFVLLNQSLAIQKQQLTAQVMTNSLLILNNQYSEDGLVSKAKNKNQ